MLFRVFRDTRGYTTSNLITTEGPKTPEDVNPGGGKKADNLFRPPPRPKRPMPPKGIIGEDFICVPEEGGGFTLISKKDEGEESARDPSKPAVRSSSGAEKNSSLLLSTGMQHAGKPKPSREDDGREVESDLDARIKRVKKNIQLLVAREVNQLARSDIFYRLGYEFMNDAMKPEDQRSQLEVTHEGQHDLTFYIERVRDEAVGMVEIMTQMTQVGGAPRC